MKAAEYGDSAADDVSAWTEVIEVMVIFVRSEGGYALTGYNDQGEAIFERTAWSVGLPAVKAEVVALAAEKGYLPDGEWTADEKLKTVLNYTRGPLRRRFRAEY